MTERKKTALRLGAATITKKTTTAPPLGAASITISFDDTDGFVVRHGSHHGCVLASKPAKDCKREEWEFLWTIIRHICPNQKNND